MNSATLQAMAVLIAHGTGEREASPDALIDAFEVVREAREWRTLGRGFYAAMRRVTLARLRARKATLVADLTSRGLPPPEAH
jgi:hypothetical protein